MLLGTVLVLTIVGVSAQNSYVEKVRKLYAEAQSAAKSHLEAELPPDDMVVTSKYMAPGAGPIEDVTHYYYKGEYDELLGAVYYDVYLVNRKYNVGAREYYQELLFDDAKLVFFLQKSPDGETRYYYQDGALAHQAVKGGRGLDEVLAMRLADDLRQAFDKLMNRNY